MRIVSLLPDPYEGLYCINLNDGYSWDRVNDETAQTPVHKKLLHINSYEDINGFRDAELNEPIFVHCAEVFKIPNHNNYDVSIVGFGSYEGSDDRGYFKDQKIWLNFDESGHGSIYIEGDILAFDEHGGNYVYISVSPSILIHGTYDGV